MPFPSNSNIITSTGQLGANVVETPDIKDDNVTLAKLEEGVDGEVLTMVAGEPDWAAPASVPVAVVIPYAGASAPTGWLLCDGASLLRAGTYADLFTAIGTTYGTADGTHFNIPDLRGRVSVGKSADTEFDTLGETGGAKTHTLQTTEIPSHSHTEHTAEADGGNDGGYVALATTLVALTDLRTTTATGGGGAHNNIQPYITLNYIIKY